ncbi:unconventional myosin-XVI-like [Arapaima gigas]
MSQYHYMSCCGFQLCNVFHSRAMEMDQCLLESLSPGQRQKLVRRLRGDQIRAYYEREKSSHAGHQGHFKKKKAPKIHFLTSDIIQDAIVHHDHKEVLRRLKDGADPNTAIPSGGSLLHLCARHDNTVVAELLIGRGLNVDQQDEELWTALHVACACNSLDTALLLLMAGANVWLQDINGNVPLDYAEEGSETNYVLLKFLEEKGVDVNALWYLKTHQPSEMHSRVCPFVATGGRVGQCCSEGVTLLQTASSSGYKEAFSQFMESEAHSQAVDSCSSTPLQLVGKNGQVTPQRDTGNMCGISLQTNIVTQLLRQGTNPVLLNCDKEKPSDITALGCIVDTLQRAEECQEQGPEMPSPPSDEQHEDLAPEMPTLNRKLDNLTFPMHKRDSIQEKSTMFPDQSLSQPAGRSRATVSLLGISPGELEQACLRLLPSNTLAVKLMPPAPNDDLASLSELTNSSLLYEMQKRFGNNQIYTYIGHILLLLNPNKELPIYSTLVSQLYLSCSGRPSPSLPPHIFSSAERAFHVMLGERRPQCFVLSGESGSGKTVACQHIVQHLVTRSGPVSLALETRMQHANCILEAFGHAKTEMNNNSSRFIKLLTLQYSEKTLISAKLHVYLLEKSRLISPPQYQRNFNIFYLMAEGISSEENSTLHLSDVLAHRYLHQGMAEDMAATGSAHSRDKLLELRQALHALGFSDLEVENLFAILSAVLHLGDLAFTAQTDAEKVSVTDPRLLEQVSGMLQVSFQDLESALTCDVRYLRGDVITRQHTVEMSSSYRDILAKALYSRVFSFLSNSISFYLQGQQRENRNPELEIGVLDIFGFEEIRKNGFEQLCINMTNEKIQQYITETLFKEEHLDCQQEGIAMETTYALRDQTPVLDFFFQVPDGLLSALDSESWALQPEEQNTYQKLQAHQTAASVLLSTKDGNGNPPLRNQGPAFSIRHYAGKVTYDLTGSVEKNKDGLPQSILFAMRSSENVLVRQVFRCKLAHTGMLSSSRHRLEPYQERTSPATAVDPKYWNISKLLKKDASSSFLQRLEQCGPVSLTVQMKNSLFEINSQLQCCTPHFIHCVKPNVLKQPDVFDSSTVSAQLQHVDVLEMVKMIRYGYPVRLPFACFLTRFRNLAATILRSDRLYSLEEKCRQVLQQSKIQGWQIGYSKVFLGYWQASQLDEQCHQLHRKIISCQKVVRSWLVRKHMRPRVPVQQRDVSKAQGFLRVPEEPGQLGYDSPVIQTASSITSDSIHLCKMIHSPVGRQEEAHTRDPNKKVSDNSTERSRILKNFCSSPVPLPLSVESLVHSAAGLSIKAPTQQTEGGGGGSGLLSPRKQPPPKPKRDPSTRLSTSIDAVSASLSVCPQTTLADGQFFPGYFLSLSLSLSLSNAALSKPRPHSDDYSAMKKVPPPKPIRSPNTKLTGSFEEISVPRAPEVKPAKTSKSQGLVWQSASVDGPHHSCHSQEEESVYIEMVGLPKTTCLPKADVLEPGECVYEEMKYPQSDEGATSMKVLQAPSEQSSPPEGMETSHVATEQSSGVPHTQSKSGLSVVPSPFPNLLPHRPPLLAFPLPVVPYSSALDESPLTPLEVKKLPVLETNLNYSGQAEGGPRQRGESSTTPVSIQDRSTPPLSPALGLPSLAKPPPPYKIPSHSPFAGDTSLLAMTRGASVANSSKGSQKGTQGSAETALGTGRSPYSPVKKTHQDSRQPQSCCSSPLLFNPGNVRPLSSPLDELSTLISAGRSLLKKSTNGRRTREPGFNSNINQPARLDSGTTSPSPRLQDNNANNHLIGSPASIENGNQLPNGLLVHEDQSNITASLHRHMDRHPHQRDQLNFSPFGAEATL